MKFIKKLSVLATAMAAMATVTVQAQTLDAFNQLRPLVITGNSTIAVNALFTTNGPFDMIGYVGRGVLLANAYTNAGGTIGFQVYTSPDTTNWTSISNYAVINANTSVIYTNLGVLSAGQIWSSTNFSVTDNYLLPYTATTPYAPLAGYNTPYAAPNQFTNAAGNVNVPSNSQWVEWSVNWTDQQRYMRFVWAATGGATNGNTVVDALWIGPRIYAP